MGASAGKPPAAPDPSTILGLQNQYNRYNSQGPFGSQTWSTGGPGGHETLNTELDPRMSQAVDRAFSAAATPYQKEYVPVGMDQLTSGILGRVGSRYGVNNMDTNLQHQKSAPGQGPQAPNMASLGINMQQPGGGMAQQGGGLNPAQVLGQPGAMGSGQMGSIGGLMGQGGGGLSGGMNQALLAAMQGGASGAPTMAGMNIGMQQPGGNTMPVTRGF